jgi:hypothetical protein
VSVFLEPLTFTEAKSNAVKSVRSWSHDAPRPRLRLAVNEFVVNLIAEIIDLGYCPSPGFHD